MPPTAPPDRSDRESRPAPETVLAAIERARRHDPRGVSSIASWTILEHLHVPRRSAGARHVAVVLRELRTDGALTRERRAGVVTWALTETGERRLAQIVEASLPESPQHQAWRNARTAAGEEIARFRDGLQTTLQDAAALLDAPTPPHSDAWLALGERLRAASWRVASASHCLYEWDEPDDAHADADDRAGPDDERLDEVELARRRTLRTGRRNVRLWDERRP
jgi:hypothetical protein